MSSSLEKQVFQPNFVKFTNTEIVDRNPISGTTFFGNQNNGFQLVKFADGSNGVEKRLKHWVGNKTGRLYRGELLGAQEYLAARVGEVMNAPVRDCHFTSKDAQSIVMPFIDGRSGAEMNDKDIPDTPQGVALRLFDYLVANADRRPKNIMFADNGNIVGIDHALCNFRPREPKPELITILWNGGVTLSSLEILKPKLLALGGLFSQMGMTEQFGNLIGNLDRLIAAFTKIQNIAVAKAAFDSQTPPQAVQQAAKQALEWIADGKAGRNFTSVGRKRASDLAHGHPVSLETLKRMKAYFDRHGVDKQTPHWNEPSPGKVAWYAWGGDAGYSWAKKMVARAEKAAEAVRKDADTDRKKADAKLKEAEALAAEAFDFRRREHFESAANAHANASRLFFEASKLYGNDENGDAVSALARGNSEKDLAESARFTDQMGEQHSPAEIHDGTWVDGGAWAGGTDPVEKGDVVGHEFHGNQYAAGIVSKLDAGESPEIASADLPGLVSGIHDLGSRGHGYDITNLKVDGEKPFQTDHDADLLREHMPQILPSQRAEFLKDIQSEYGIVSKAEEVNPKTLKPSQTEIDGWKTGGVYKEFAEKGIPAERAPLVSSDNYIIDGHHYWSAAIALKAANPDYKLPIRRLSCDLDTALKVANQWHDKVGNPRLSLGDTQVSKSGVAGQSGDKEGHAFRGNQWWMMGPDGVPVPRPRAPKTDTGDKTPAAPKAPRVSTPRAPKATPTAETPKPIYQEDLKVPYGKGVIPPGWKKTGTTSVVIPSRDWSKPPKIVNCTTFSSAKGNTAIIGTRARGWKIGDRYTNTVLMTIDRFATGKQVEFVHTLRQGANTLASVSLGNPNSLMIGRYGIIGRDLKAGIEKYRPNYQTDDMTPEAIKAQADWDSLKDTAVAQAKGEINTQEGRDALDKVEATLQAADNSNLAKGFTIDKLGRTWNTGDLFMSSQRRIESTIIHELGHSNFFSDGKKITDVIPELQKSLGSKVDLSKENESGKRDFVRNIKTPALNFGGKTIVPRGEVKDFLDKHEPGIYPLSLDTTKALKAIGGTKYGTSSLQELGAESFAQFQLGITQSPITQAFATSLGWQQAGTTVAKSGSVADMSQSQSPNVYYSPEFGGEVARVFLEDSLDGPRLVVGDSVENYGHPDQTDDSTEDEE